MLMQRTALFIFACLLCTISAAFGQKQSCDNFKYGKFKSANSERQGAKVLLERVRPEVQVETITYRGTTYTNNYKIVWRSNCSYTLFPVKSAKELNPFAKVGDSLHVSIQQVLPGNKATVMMNAGGKMIIDIIYLYRFLCYSLMTPGNTS
jgi:hypothetical protein